MSSISGKSMEKLQNKAQQGTKVILVEGPADVQLYKRIYPDAEIKSWGSCDRIIEAIEVFNRTLGKNSSVVGIVDRDVRTDEEIKALSEENVFVLGERERGTLETLLTFPIKSKDIIIGKFLGVSTSSIITGLISLVLSIVSLIVSKNAFSIYEGIDVMFSPVSIIFAAIVIIAYSFFISGLCIAVASTSKTFKEAQSALTPLTFISFFPGMIAFMIGVTGTPLISIIPFLNFTVIFTDINSGTLDVLNILLMIISTIVYISLVLAYIIKQYKSEKVLFAK